MSLNFPCGLLTFYLNFQMLNPYSIVAQVFNTWTNLPSSNSLRFLKKIGNLTTYTKILYQNTIMKDEYACLYIYIYIYTHYKRENLEWSRTCLVFDRTGAIWSWHKFPSQECTFRCQQLPSILRCDHFHSFSRFL